jgi:hypothetical protein
MQDEEAVAAFQRKAKIVREIAKGIYDKTERQTLLKFVSDSEKLAAGKALKARD